MGKSDVEMEDAEKPPRDSRENIQDHERKSPDSNGESNRENFPSETELAVAGDANNSEIRGEDLNEFTYEAKQEATLNREVENQINPKGEVIESMDSVGSVSVQINAINENMEQINTKSNAENQTDAENELVEQSPTNGSVKEEKSTDNDMQGGDHVKNVIEENLSMGDCVENVAHEENNIGNADSEKYTVENTLVQTDKSQGECEEMEDEVNVKEGEGEAAKGELKEQGNEVFPASPAPNENVMTGTSVKHEIDDCSLPNQREPGTANSLVTYPHSRDGDHSGQKGKGVFTLATLPPMAESDDGTLEEQAAFMKELESFYRERAMDFKPPKFYGQPLNCLKLWRATIKLGGYDRVTGCKLWRLVGESFHPPKTCTTVSWTFRIFYEKSLLEFERHKTQSGELQLPVAAVPEASVVQNEGGYQGSTPVSSGRARRDSAARAMQGWHVQRLNGNGEVAEPVIKDKNLYNMAKREKNLKSIGSIKQKRPNEVENSVKAARTETYTQLVTSVVDVGPPADWVKINVRQLNDCFEVYALVPGLLREEVRVQSDPAGRLVITGQPDQVENPWGITPFKKVVSLPARIDPLQTSAVVSLHGRLFVRVPFE